jgi:RNA-directed DNA polymerase
VSEAKPFVISKWEVQEAYQRVKANQRAAGVDEQSTADFERNLKRNLYRIWNRMFDHKRRCTPLLVRG